METLGLILTAVGCTAAATWLIRSAISDVAGALTVHVVEEDHRITQLEGKVIDLASKRKRR